MKLLIQRVRAARVEVAGEVVGAIDQGLLALVGIEPQAKNLCLWVSWWCVHECRVTASATANVPRCRRDVGISSLISR